MPSLTVHTNTDDNQITNDLLKQLSAVVAKAVGKPEQYVAVHVLGGQKLFFGGTNDPAALMEFMSMNLSANQTGDISKQIMVFFEEKFNIKSDRIYIKFINLPGNMIGYNKDTF